MSRTVTIKAKIDTTINNQVSFTSTITKKDYQILKKTKNTNDGVETATVMINNNNNNFLTFKGFVEVNDTEIKIVLNPNDDENDVSVTADSKYDKVKNLVSEPEYEIVITVDSEYKTYTELFNGKVVGLSKQFVKAVLDTSGKIKTSFDTMIKGTPIPITIIINSPASLRSEPGANDVERVTSNDINEDNLVNSNGGKRSKKGGKKTTKKDKKSKKGGKSRKNKKTESKKRR
jgi:hypothetical protein